MHLFCQSQQIKGAIESILFVSEKPVSIKLLSSLLNTPKEELDKLIEELIEDYKKRESGILIIKIDDSYQMVTNPKYGDWVSLFKNLNGQSKLSSQALETLAVIAYKQPITKAEIEKIRGSNSEYALKTLLEKRLIKIVGKKELPGRPFLYGTTKEFLRVFGISSLNELYSLLQFQKINAA